MEADGRESERRFTADSLLVWRLVPFFASCTFYFLLWLHSQEPSWTSALAKCLPIHFLALFVHNTTPLGPYGQFIRLGLLCSILGDLFITWPDKYLVGMVASALAHLFYLKALGGLPTCRTFLQSVMIIFLLCFGLLQPHLPSHLSLPVVVYAAILCLMLWRALVRGRSAAVSGLFFSISHALRVWTTFVCPLPEGHLMVMVTYYTAQALLALSAVEGRAPQH
ncbi:lysoplasmalogenase-like [Vombatus ursinus]|uniref:lysoplasmalogenase-like n=1 Tax=Vombatus ursinus TaxID=29139 RepID=UPI000FFCE92C|nr:lysoplasmalogenase-like [Vombatus ursinus]